MNDAPLSPPPNPQTRPPYPYIYPPYLIEEDEINLLDLWYALIRYKKMIIGITLIFTIIAVAFAFLMTPIYRAKVLLAPVSDDDQRTLSAMASQLGGIASLAGINLGSGGSGTDQAVATLASQKFISDFIADNQLLPVLYDDRWDATKKSWASKSSDEIPTAQDAYKKFNDDILNISTDKKTGLVTVSVDWKNPQQAAVWANELVNRINRREQQTAIKDAEQSIAYLKEQLSRTSIVEMQQAIYQLMEAQTKKIMLAKIRDQYAFKVIDPAIAPEKKIKPKTVLIIAAGLTLGLVTSMIFALLRLRLVASKGSYK